MIFVEVVGEEEEAIAINAEIILNGDPARWIVNQEGEETGEDGDPNITVVSQNENELLIQYDPGK